MAKRVNPRHGSMQFWPRVRASKQYAKVRSLPPSQEAKPLVFAGYKAGRTHLSVTDNTKNSLTKGEKISMPVTIIECPPVKIASVRFYTPAGYGSKIEKELFFKTDKEFVKKAKLAKTISNAEDLEKVDLAKISNITIQVYTQPKLVGFGKKKPEVIELGLGGSNEEKIAFIKERIGKDIPVSDVLAKESFVDVRAVTTGRGYQGPVKRFGIGLRAKKSEKTKRGPGSLGSWKGQGHMMYRIAYAGQVGYHQRTQYNNFIVDIRDDVESVNPQGGILHFGEVKNTYVLIKGSIPGPKKRLIVLTNAQRAHHKSNDAQDIILVSNRSQQGN